MRLILIFCLLLFNLGVIGQENTFIRTYNLPGMNGGLALAVMEDGGFVGTGQHADGVCRIYAYRIDECGNIIWFNLYNSGGGVAIDATYDNGVIIAADGGRLLKIDSVGTPEWEKTYSSVGSYMTAVIQTTDSGYFAGGQYGQLLKLDNLGEVVWSASVSGTSIHALDEFPNGDLMYFSWDDNSFWIGRVSQQGVLIWENQYSSGSSRDSHHSWAGEALIDTNLSRIIVASNSSNNSGDVLVTSIDYNGNIITSNAFGSVSASEFVRSIDITDDGGYIIGGGTYGYNTTSTSVLTQAIGLPPENLSGRDILLFKVDSLINFEWSSVIGCGGTEKAIGVRTNQDNGYTVSAYTDGGFFGAIDIDPLFIKTDSMGRVGCQQYSPILTQTSIATSVTPTNNLSITSSTATTITVSYNSIAPADYYMCLDCSTTPFFTISDTTLCVGDTTYFVNGSSGLTCFQDWFVDGNPITASADSTPFAFSTPGLHNILLETNCGSGTVQYQLDFYVNDLQFFVTDISNYNGYEVSCEGYNDGFIETYATSPFPPVNYNWNTSSSSNLNQYNLSVGIYTLQLTDDYGCILDTSLTLTEPTILQTTITSSTDYNGYNISCNGYSDGGIDLSIFGSVSPYSYLWSTLETTQDISSLSLGTYSVDITDLNSCTTSTSFALSEPKPLYFDFILVSPDTCGKGVGSIEIIIKGGANAYTYDWSNGEDSSYVNNLNTGIFEVIITDINQCIINKEITIYNLKSPLANFNASPTLVRFFDQLENPIKFSDNSEGYWQNITNWNWNFDYDGYFPTDYDAFDSITDHSFIELGTFRVFLKIETEHHCIDTISKNVEIFDYDIFIPNAFTPGNKDDVNNTFKAYAYGFKQFNMEIFSRWGELLFATDDIEEGWDGRKLGKNEICQSGNYVYNIKIINLDDRVLKYVDYFLLLR